MENQRQNASKMGDSATGAGQPLSPSDYAEIIGNLPPNVKTAIQTMLHQHWSGTTAEKRDTVPPEQQQRPTPEDLENMKADKALAVCIVAALVLDRVIEIKEGELSGEIPDFMWTVDTVRRAIRETMPRLDIVEIEWLCKGGDQK